MQTQEKTKQMMQSVVITFKDGEKAVFTGPAVVFKNQEKTIADIVFTNPKPIPEDCEWGKI